MENKESYLERTLEFNKIYSRQILPMLGYYEEYRKKEYNKLLLQWIVIAAGILLMLYVCYLILVVHVSQNPYIIFLFPISTLGIIILLLFFYPYYLHKQNKKFKNILKSRCLSKLISVFGNLRRVDNISDAGEVYLHERKDWIGSELFYGAQTIETDDYFEGETPEGIKYSIEEASFCSWKRGYARRKNLFRGVILTFQFNKSINTEKLCIYSKGDTPVRMSDSLAAGLIVLAVFLQLSSKFPECIILFPAGILLSLIIGFCVFVITNNKTQENVLKRTSFEDTKFNSRFNVYTDNEMEARYLLTPKFMEKLLNLTTVFGTKNLRAEFRGDRLIIAIETKKDLFEMGSLFKSLKDPSSVKQLYNQFSSIEKLVKYLELNKNIG